MVTSGFVMQGLPNPDGHVFIPINPANGTANPGVRTRLGGGLAATVQPAATASVYEISLDALLFRYGMQDDSQMAFGTRASTSGAAALPLLPGVLDISPYSRLPRPPIASANVFGNGGSAVGIAKGIAIKGVSLVYQPIGAALTSVTIGITKTQFANGVAPVVTNILPNVNNGLLLAVAAQPVITTIPVPVVNQVMLTNRFAEYLIEIDPVTAGGGTLNLFGIFLDLAYNYN